MNTYTIYNADGKEVAKIKGDKIVGSTTGAYYLVQSGGEIVALVPSSFAIVRM
ncbi:MAG: hypothetical protein V4675_20010 [Verrucomicrobiota bacterium]